MSSSYMYENSYLTDLQNLRKGDLIFMGEEDTERISHIAIFEKLENNNIYFIDSTQKDNIDGVSKRFYSQDDKKIKAFGIMYLNSPN